MLNVMATIEPPSATWVISAVNALRRIRHGNENPYAPVESVRLVDSVTYDAEGRAYYHLATRARELLRANGGLPWGRS